MAGKELWGNMTEEDEALARRTKFTEQYMDSLYQKTNYQLREEVRRLYVKCYMVNDCAGRLKKEITKLLAKEGKND